MHTLAKPRQRMADTVAAEAEQDTENYRFANAEKNELGESFTKRFNTFFLRTRFAFYHG